MPSTPDLPILFNHVDDPSWLPRLPAPQISQLHRADDVISVEWYLPGYSTTSHAGLSHYEILVHIYCPEKKTFVWQPNYPLYTDASHLIEEYLIYEPEYTFFMVLVAVDEHGRYGDISSIHSLQQYPEHYDICFQSWLTNEL